MNCNSLCISPIHNAVVLFCFFFHWFCSVHLVHKPNLREYTISFRLVSKTNVYIVSYLCLLLHCMRIIFYLRKSSCKELTKKKYHNKRICFGIWWTVFFSLHFLKVNNNNQLDEFIASICRIDKKNTRGNQYILKYQLISVKKICEFLIFRMAVFFCNLWNKKFP